MGINTAFSFVNNNAPTQDSLTFPKAFLAENPFTYIASNESL